MKKLSYWAREHKQAARLTIVISFILLTGLGLITGGLLMDSGIAISYNAFLLTLIIYCIIFLIYPSAGPKKKIQSPASFYFRRKSCDLVLAAITFCMVIYIGNQPGSLFKYVSSANAGATSANIIPKDSSVKTYKSFKEFSASMKDENGKMLKWKERKRLLKEQVKAIKKSDNTSKGRETGLIILSVLVALGLLYLVASLACSLSCNGSEAAAIIVGIGGAGLVIFLLVITIRGILGKKRKKKNQEIMEPPNPEK